MNTVEDGYSRVYCPERVSFSSKDDKTSLTNDGTIGFYDSFRIPLQTPILGVKSLELIRATVPCVYPTLPDSELVFWYYKLPKQTNFDEPVPPDMQYLHCVRIQPSFVPKELIYPIGEDYPVNRVYDGYEDLLLDLNKACLYDVNNPYFVAGDVKFEYNKETKKFVFIGNHETMPITRAIPNLPASWNGAIDYVKDQTVSYNGHVYMVNFNNTGIPPDSSQLVGVGPILRDANNQYVRDENGQYVYSSYTAAGPLYWQQIGASTETLVVRAFYSYAGCNDPNVMLASRILFNSSLNNFGIQGLKGQPFFDGRTLNLRLGFTWDGTLLSQNSYRNHIRPVPNYIIGQDVVFNVYKYVAETYCDLVHTANLHVYCNLIGGAGYDSAGRPDLLNVIPLQTGVLGVASYQNSIDTHLTKVPREIYEVQFILRTDSGDRFVLPKSAITNFEIKFAFN